MTAPANGVHTTKVVKEPTTHSSQVDSTAEKAHTTVVTNERWFLRNHWKKHSSDGREWHFEFAVEVGMRVILAIRDQFMRESPAAIDVPLDVFSGSWGSLRIRAHIDPLKLEKEIEIRKPTAKS